MNTSIMPAGPDNTWEPVTRMDSEVRDGPVLKRIGVPGGFLYMVEVCGNATALVFVAVDRS